MLSLVLFLLMFITSSIGQEPMDKIDPFLLDDIFLSEYAIYGSKGKLSRASFTKYVEKALPGIKLLDAYSEDIPNQNTAVAFYLDDVKKTYPVYDREALEYFSRGLSEKEIEGLLNSEEAVILTLVGKSANSIELNRKLKELIFDYASLKKGIIFDSVTREYFNAASFKETRIETDKYEVPDLTNEFTIHAYRESEFCRIVTLGMAKYGLPDLVINNASCLSSAELSSLINVTAQQLTTYKFKIPEEITLDLKKINNENLKRKIKESLLDNAEQKVNIKLKAGVHEEGDPDNYLLEIDFDNTDYPDPQSYQNYIVSTLFGSADAISSISHNQAILEASEKARAQLPILKDMFNKGLELNHAIMLKAPFETDEGENEWMWVEVTKWEDAIRGILQNEPFNVSGLKAGSIVTINQEEIFDYIWMKSDGTQEGNTTGEIIMKMQSGN